MKLIILLAITLSPFLQARIVTDEANRFRVSMDEYWLHTIDKRIDERVSSYTFMDGKGSLKKVEVMEILPEIKEAMGKTTMDDCLKGMGLVTIDFISQIVPKALVLFKKHVTMDDGVEAYFIMFDMPEAALTSDECGKKDDSLRGYLGFFKNDKYINLSFSMSERILEFRRRKGLSKENTGIYFQYLKDMYQHIEIL